MLAVKIFFLSFFIILTLNKNADTSNKAMIALPSATISTERGLPQILRQRYSCRTFSHQPLNLEQVAAFLWAAAGKIEDSVTGASRTTPSAGATFPLEIYIVVGKGGVVNLEEGLYHYLIEKHALEPISLGQDISLKLSAACLGQTFINDAPISLIIAAKFSRTSARYGQRGIRYVYMEAGSACQNIYLMATQLGLATVQVGAFDDNNLDKLLLLDKDTQTLSIMPVGYAR
jgi:SagB-type dehydrogenase family enzyme